MTFFLIHTAVETESKEMDKLIPAIIEKLDKVPDNKLKETYQKYDYADKEYISLAILRNGKFIYFNEILEILNKFCVIENIFKNSEINLSSKSGSLLYKREKQLVWREIFKLKIKKI